MSTHYRIVETRLGWCSFVRSADGLQALETPRRTEGDARRLVQQRHPEADEDETLAPDFVAQLQAYFSGKPIVFDVPLDLAVGTPFQQQVWEACQRIGYGDTASYRALAEAVGKPQAARAVGMAMKRNPLPIVIPCHRICRHDGTIGGYSGTGGLDLKRELLGMEATATEPV